MHARRILTLVLTLVSLTQASAGEVGLIFWALGDHAPPTAELEAFAPRMRLDVVRMSSIPRLGSPGVVLPATLKDGDQVTTIVIGTSARAPRLDPRTVLDGIGGFGRAGAFGELKRLLARLGRGGRLAPRLHLALLAPDALGNGSRAVEARVKALANELAPYGVRELSVWGPSGSLLVPAKSGQSKWQLAGQQVRESLLRWGSLLPTYFVFVGVRYYFDQDLERTGIMLATFTAAFAAFQLVANLRPLFQIFRGQTGRLVRVNVAEDTVSTSTVALDSAAAYKGPACGTALE